MYNFYFSVIPPILQKLHSCLQTNKIMRRKFAWMVRKWEEKQTSSLPVHCVPFRSVAWKKQHPRILWSFTSITKSREVGAWKRSVEKWKTESFLLLLRMKKVSFQLFPNMTLLSDNVRVWWLAVDNANIYYSSTCRAEYTKLKIFSLKSHASGIKIIKEIIKKIWYTIVFLFRPSVFKTPLTIFQ